MTFLSMSPLWLLLAVYVFYTIWILKNEADALRYWLENSTLRVEEGVVTLKRKSIPLDRITGVVLVQNIFMRPAGIWALKVQTAGSSEQRPEAELFGMLEAEVVRDQIMQARGFVVGSQSLSIS